MKRVFCLFHLNDLLWFRIKKLHRKPLVGTSLADPKHRSASILYSLWNNSISLTFLSINLNQKTPAFTWPQYFLERREFKVELVPFLTDKGFKFNRLPPKIQTCCNYQINGATPISHACHSRRSPWQESHPWSKFEYTLKCWSG